MADHSTAAPVSFTDTPEFKAAVEAAAHQAAAAAVARLVAEAQAGKPVGTGDENTRFIQQLALSIAQLTGQQSGQKYIAPEIIQARDQAREFMTELLVEANATGKVATYQLTTKMVLDFGHGPQLIEPAWLDGNLAKPTEIDWPYAPNDGMIPLNATAKAIKAAWLESVGTAEKVAPDERLGITRNGRVVKGGAVQQRRELDTPAPIPSGLSIHHKDRPGQYVQKNILGTVHPPALQTA